MMIWNLLGGRRKIEMIWWDDALMADRWASELSELGFHSTMITSFNSLDSNEKLLGTVEDNQRFYAVLGVYACRANHHFKVTLRDSILRFPIARLFGCLGFTVAERDSPKFALGMFRTEITEQSLAVVASTCCKLTPDVRDDKAIASLDQICSFYPELIYPKNRKNKGVYGHFGRTSKCNYIAVTSDRYYKYQDWLTSDKYREIQRRFEEIGVSEIDLVVTAGWH